jgi:hypothetical protein
LQPKRSYGRAARPRMTPDNSSKRIEVRICKSQENKAPGRCVSFLPSNWRKWASEFVTNMSYRWSV